MIRKGLTCVSFIVLILAISCVNSDTVEPPKSDPVLMIEPHMTSLLIGETIQLNVIYTNEEEELESITPEFHNITPNILDISGSGLVTALAKGKGKIVATFEDTKSDTTIINVVGSTNELASVVITGPKNNLDVNEEMMLTATGYTINEVEISGTHFTWSSEDPDIATVDESGNVKGVSKGFTKIIASSEEIDGFYSISVDIGAMTATLMGGSGYSAKGTAELKLENLDIILTLSDDFETSFALGTFIYLANSKNGAEVKSMGFEVGEVTTNGAHTFNISEIAEENNTSVAIGQYKYIIVLCKPAAVTFGYGEFK